jgi:hypothetical protein
MRMGAREWVLGKRAARKRALAHNWGESVAHAVEVYVVNLLLHELQLDTNDARAIAGVTDALTDAAALMSLGASIGGVYGAAIGAVVGAIEGAIRGSWPSGREDVRHKYQDIIRQCPPAVKLRLWRSHRAYADLCRHAEGKTPQGPGWRIMDQENVNLYGSPQIIVRWFTDDLFRSHWYARAPAPRVTSAGGRAALVTLPGIYLYALGVLVCDAPDSQAVGYEPLSRNIACIDDISCGDVFQARNVMPELHAWVAQHHSDVTAAQIRAELAARGSPGITVFPRAPEIQALLDTGPLPGDIGAGRS